MVDTRRSVTVGVGLRDFTVEVPPDATGYEIKRCLYLGDNDLCEEVLSWQLQGRNANGSNSVIGNNDRPWHSYFDLMTIYDNA